MFPKVLINRNYREGFPTKKARSSKVFILERTGASSGAHFSRTIAGIPLNPQALCEYLV